MGWCILLVEEWEEGEWMDGKSIVVFIWMEDWWYLYRIDYQLDGHCC
jgi:hypothetical protein